MGGGGHFGGKQTNGAVPLEGATFSQLSRLQWHRARIHTGFHRFTEIGQIFHNRYIFSKIFKPSKLKSGKWFGESVNILSEWLRNPGKGTLGG